MNKRLRISLIYGIMMGITLFLLVFFPSRHVSFGDILGVFVGTAVATGIWYYLVKLNDKKSNNIQK